MRRKGFTLVELLVVIAIIALLMGILMPALARVRQLAFRLTCGTNLSGIGKAMMIYANDYEDELPRAGGRETTWGQTPNWMGNSRFAAFGVNPSDGSGGQASISSCFYLLVKYAEVTPKSFVCKGDAGTTEFSLSDLPSGTVSTTFELIDAWDFGPPAEAYKHCSYSYHIPFNLYALTTSSEPGFAVAADRNPWIESPAAGPADFTEFLPDIRPWNGSNEEARAGNAIGHQNDGQQALFLDIHVEFAKRAYCSIEDDNIYTLSTDPRTGTPLGTAPTATPGLEPANRKDSLLVHDPPTGLIEVKPRCFLADTPVWVGGTLVPISEATAGQTILPAHGRVALAAAGSLTVEAVQAHPGVHYDARRVVLENGEVICVVDSHFFLLDNGLWVPVQQLGAGSVLRTLSGPVKVVAVVPQKSPYVGVVYNLKIKEADHYFVGRAGAVVRDY
jgi:prepilin-type N-terminal cleavage/methylation domain-containing protein